MSISSQEPPGGWDRPAPVAAVDSYGVKFSQKRAWVLSIVTSGVWSAWWLFSARTRFDAELADGRDDALKHTLFLCVPILNLFVVLWLWRDLSVLRQRVGLSRIPLTGYMVGAVLLAPVSFTLALNRYNEYWDARFQGHALDAPSTTGEKVSIALGVVVSLLNVVLIALVVLLVLVVASTN